MNHSKINVIQKLSLVCVLMAAGCVPLFSLSEQVVYPKHGVRIEFSGNMPAPLFQQASDGGYFVVGFVEPSDPNESYPMGVAKVDQDLKVVWKKEIALSQDPIAICGTADGGCAILSSYSESYLTKIDETGEIEWSKSLFDSYNSVIQADDGYIVAGATFLYFEDQNQASVLKTDSNGEIVASSLLPIAQDSESSTAVNIVNTSDGNYAIFGTNYSNVDYGQTSSWLAKIDPDGLLLWAQRYEDSDLAIRMIETKDGGFVMFTNDEFWRSHVRKTDASGNLLWDKTSQEECLSTNVCASSDNGCVTMGTVLDPLGANRIAAMSSEGDDVWERYIGSFFNPIVCGDLRRANDGTYVVMSLVVDSFSLEELDGDMCVYLFRLDENGNPV